MKTFLPQNKFYSAVDIPSSADEAGASAPAPLGDAPAEISDDISSAQSSCGVVVSRHEDTRSREIIARETPAELSLQALLCRSSNKPAASMTGGEKMKGLVGANSDRIGNDVPRRSGGFESSLAGVAPSPQAEAAIDSCQEPVAADLSDCIGLLFYHARRLALPRFAPDYEAIWSAMHDPNAPRMLAGDPVWADASPIFLGNT